MALFEAAVDGDAVWVRQNGGEYEDSAASEAEPVDMGRQLRDELAEAIASIRSRAAMLVGLPPAERTRQEDPRQPDA
ncbi:hypothetical protein [Streptomyces sp. NPDC040750]|uniref:hypothetical protein n=1 Tax=Streptomyces sp. NPDC040750 TaxID=3154491 RepID=UPI0033C3860E